MSDFIKNYEKTLVVGSERYSLDKSELVSCIPIYHHSIWNNERLIKWIIEKFPIDNRNDVIQSYLTFAIQDLNSKLDFYNDQNHYEYFIYFLHFMDSYQYIDKLDFINRICVKEMLMKTYVQDKRWIINKRVKMENANDDMMGLYGNFFLTLIDLM